MIMAKNKIIGSYTDKEIKGKKGKIFVDGFKRFEVETIEEFADVIKNHKAIAKGIYKDGYKKIENLIQYTSFIFIDVDDTTLTFEGAKKKLLDSGLEFYMQTSSSHTKERQKFHIFIPVYYSDEEDMEAPEYNTHQGQLKKKQFEVATRILISELID